MAQDNSNNGPRRILMDGDAMRASINKAMAPPTFAVADVRCDPDITIVCGCKHIVVVIHSLFNPATCPTCGTQYQVRLIEYDVTKLIERAHETGQPMDMSQARMNVQLAVSRPRIERPLIQ